MSIKLDRDTPFDLDSTLSCGQVFRWRKIGNTWQGLVGRTYLTLSKVGDRLTSYKFPEDTCTSFVQRYLRLDDDLHHIVQSINKDEVIAKAIDSFPGLRLVRQDPWECLITFICATYANIPRIKQMVENLSQRFGEEIRSVYGTYFAFPREEALAKATVKELVGCGLGFRARYVLQTARIVYEGFDIKGLRRIKYEDAKKELLALPGVGSKVADCVLLFSLDKLEAFPVDVWIYRIMTEHYDRQLPKARPSAQYRAISDFGRAYFEEHAGYAQEYLYHYFKSRHGVAIS